VRVRAMPPSNSLRAVTCLAFMVILCAAAAAFKAHRPTNDAKWLKDYVNDKTPVATTEQVTRVQMKKNRAWKAHASKVANGVGDAQNKETIGCGELQLKTPNFPQRMVEAFHLIEKNVISQQELATLGNIGRVKKQMACYIGILRHLQLRGKTICEIGVNGGHSSALMLANSDPSNTYIGFDLDPAGQAGINKQGQHDETTLNAVQQSRVMKAHRYLNDYFSGRFKLVLGDSKVMGPKYLGQNNITCALLSIDGDHSPQGIVGDWRAFRPFVEPGTLVVLDDVWRSHPVWKDRDMSIVACIKSSGLADSMTNLHSDASLPAGRNFCVGRKK